jgi:hypothetical protein
MESELCDHGNGEAFEVCPVCFVDESASDYTMALAAAKSIADSDLDMTYDSALLGNVQTAFVYWQLLNMKSFEAESLGPELTRAREYVLAFDEAMAYWHAGNWQN